MLISENMYLFLKDYMKWIEEGAIDDEPYYCSTGLCFNAFSFTNYVRARPLLEELKILFEAEGLNRQYPFGEGNFDARIENKTQYLDPIRLEWIKDHIEEYEKVNGLVKTLVKHPFSIMGLISQVKSIWK